MLENKKMKKQRNNKGFSLVELIVVIAIMAVLVGVVGMQVIPYIEKSKEAKDVQILSAINTAAVTSYATNAAKLKTTTGTITVSLFSEASGGATPAKEDAYTIQEGMKEFMSYKAIADITKEMSSKVGKTINGITIEVDLTNNKIKLTPAGGGDVTTKFPAMESPL